MPDLRLRIASLALLLSPLLVSGPEPAHAADGLWDKINQSGELVCGAMASSPPGSFQVSGPAQFEGYVIAHCRQIAEDLSAAMGKNIKPVLVETTWPTVVLDLQSKRLDIFPGMSDTPERRKAIDMAGPLYNVDFCLVNRKGLTGLKSWDDYNKRELKIASITGTTDEHALHTYAPNATNSSFKNVAEMVLAVQAGRADALTTSLLTCLDIASKNPTVFGEIIVPTPARGLPSSAGLAKDSDGRLTKWLEAWAADARSSGKTKRLFHEALRKAGLDPTAIPDGFSF